MPSPLRVALMLELELPYRRHTEIYAGIQRYAREQGWITVVDEYAADTLRPASGQRPSYDGIIARATRKLVRGAVQQNIPLVNVWYSSPVWRTVPAVYPDYTAVGKQLAEHLVDRGLNRIACVNVENDHGSRDILRAFGSVVKRAGCAFSTAWIPRDATGSLANWRRTERALGNLLKSLQPPVGVYVGSEFAGWMVVQLCQELGWHIPRDLAIVTGINEIAHCEHIFPTLTSIELGTERIGYEAACLLGGLMKGASPPKAPIVMPPLGLVVRESTDFMHSDDPLIAAALAYIAQNSHLPIQRSDVAEAVHIGQRTLERRFMDHLQRSVAAEIRRARIERAKRELAQTERSLAEIATAVGLSTAAHMHQVFVREAGLTPTEYRQQQILPRR